ncbi:MAG: Gfo/Idh/MocA family protein [Thermoplasmata archaeon]
MEFGIISLGRHAMTKVIPAIRKAGYKISFIYSTDGGKGERVAREIDAQYVPDLEKFAMMGFDAVYISSPNSLHFPHAKICLDAGKSVLLEKPATLKVEEIVELDLLAKRKGVRLSIGFHLRFHPAVEDVKKIISSGEIGRVLYSYGKWSYYSPRSGDTSWKSRADMAGGGSLVGTGVHVIDSFINLFGNDVRGVSATNSPKCSVIDETAHATLHFSSGIVADGISSRMISDNYNDLLILGEKGSIRVTNLYSTSVDSELHVNGSFVKRYEGTDMYEEEIKAFAHGDSRIAGGEAGIISTKLLLAIQRSACNGTTVEL